MKLASIFAIATFGLFIACTDAKSHKSKGERYEWLLSEKTMRPSKIEKFCRGRGGRPAALDKKTLRSAMAVLKDFTGDVLFGSRVGKKQKKPLMLVVDEKGTHRYTRAEKKKRLHVLCQRRIRTTNSAKKSSSNKKSRKQKYDPFA